MGEEEDSPFDITADDGFEEEQVDGPPEDHPEVPGDVNRDEDAHVLDSDEEEGGPEEGPQEDEEIIPAAPEEGRALTLDVPIPENTRLVDLLPGPDQYMTEYERTSALIQRVREISAGKPPYIIVPKGMTSTYEIAVTELINRRNPGTTARRLPNGKIYDIPLADLKLKDSFVWS